MLTTARDNRGGVGGFGRLIAFMKKMLPNRRLRLEADTLSPAARRDLLLPDPAPDPREPWY